MKRAVVSTLSVAALACASLFALRWRHQHQIARSHVDVTPLVQALTAAKQPPSAIAALNQACSAGDACRCTEQSGRAALDADLPALAMHALDTAPHGCQPETNLLGERAEAQARASKLDTAQQTADATFKKDATNPYAQLALARIAYEKNQMAACDEHADIALQHGRGVEAERWLGRAALARGKYKEAEAHFAHLLDANPNDAEAAFTDGICNDNLGHYREAREAFLQTLRIDPKHPLARVYLVVLTFKAGAKDEARHHLQKLAEVMPKDSPRFVELQKLVDGDQDAGVVDAGTVTQVQGKLMVQGKH